MIESIILSTLLLIGAVLVYVKADRIRSAGLMLVVCVLAVGSLATAVMGLLK